MLKPISFFLIFVRARLFERGINVPFNVSVGAGSLLAFAFAFQVSAHTFTSIDFDLFE